MNAADELHRATQHRCAMEGVEAFTLASNRSFPRHAHDQFGVGVLQAGAQRSWSRAGQVEAAAGDVITVNPGEIHDGQPADDRPRAWRMLYLDPPLMVRVLGEDAPGAPEFIRPVVRDARRARSLHRLFAAVTAPAQQAIAIEERLAGMLVGLMTFQGSGRLQTGGPPRSVRLALQRMDEAPQTPVTLADLAALSGVSRFQLLRGFAREVGTTPHGYLVQQRVRLARRLLLAGMRPAAAAAAAGFADQSHLTRAFRRQLGVTPARYRAALA